MRVASAPTPTAGYLRAGTKIIYLCFPSSSGTESASNTRDVARTVGSIPRLGRSPGEENGNPLQYSCLGNPTDKGAWKAAVHGGNKKVQQDLVIKLQQ